LNELQENTAAKGAKYARRKVNSGDVDDANGDELVLLVTRFSLLFPWRSWRAWRLNACPSLHRWGSFLSHGFALGAMTL
jgi:hypothetical protein